MASRRRELGRKGVVVGDRVALVGDVSGEVDALARIVRVEPRTSVLRRTADDSDPVERVLVANADQLVVVTALADPEPRPRLIDRCLVAAYDAGLAPLLVLTKADLRSPDELLAGLRRPRRPRARDHPRADGGIDVEPLLERLRGRTSVLVGHSGVGKSTLVNALVPDAHRAIGRVNDVTGRGRHTSSSAVTLRLPDGAGWVIDTPGVRSFGLAHVDPRAGHQRVPRPGARHGGVPPWLLARRAGVRARRVGRGRGYDRRTAGLVPAPAAQPYLRRRRDDDLGGVDASLAVGQFVESIDVLPHRPAARVADDARCRRWPRCRPRPPAPRARRRSRRRARGCPRRRARRPR